MFFNSFFIELIGFPIDDPEGSGGTFSQTGPEPVTQFIGDNSGFTVHNLKGAFRTGRDTLPASVTQFFIDLDYFS
jgi:hypothetical protein